MSAGSLCSSSLPCSLGSQVTRQIVAVGAGASPNGAFSLTTPATTGFCIITGDGTSTRWYCPTGIYNTVIPSNDGNGAGFNPLLTTLQTPVDAGNSALMLKSSRWIGGTTSPTTYLQMDFNQAPANGLNVFVSWWSPGGKDSAGIGKINYWTYNMATATAPP